MISKYSLYILSAALILMSFMASKSGAETNNNFGNVSALHSKTLTRTYTTSNETYVIDYIYNPSIEPILENIKDHRTNKHHTSFIRVYTVNTNNTKKIYASFKGIVVPEGGCIEDSPEVIINRAHRERYTIEARDANVVSNNNLSFIIPAFHYPVLLTNNMAIIISTNDADISEASARFFRVKTDLEFLNKMIRDNKVRIEEFKF